MIYARQSTAIIVTVGPVLDADGVAVTGGVVGDFKISKNGGAPAALNGSATLTHRFTGHYSLSLTTSDVDTVGTAEIVIDDTVNACPMKEIQVVEPATYDVLFADAAPGPASPTNITAGTIATVTNVTTVNGLAAGVITAASIATGAIDADSLAADAGTEIGTAVWASGTRVLTASTNLGDLDDAVLAILGTPAGASLAADIAAIEAQTDDIGVAGVGLTAIPWNAAWDAEVQSEVADALAVYDPPTNAEMEARTLVAANYATSAALTVVDDFLDSEVAAILTDTNAIKVQTDKLTFTVANQLDANVQSINDAALTGDGSGTPWGPA
jgi:hypothetical protein